MGSIHIELYWDHAPKTWFLIEGHLLSLSGDHFVHPLSNHLASYALVMVCSQLTTSNVPDSDLQLLEFGKSIFCALRTCMRGRKLLTDMRYKWGHVSQNYVGLGLLEARRRTKRYINGIYLTKQINVMQMLDYYRNEIKNS
ncbi:hypothetical protein K501DRAFT_265307 [Backusella circina FSU 941]|nr:hypothetical protein K501DRAFT_265307 [Backusella circina FSU 941]